MKELFNIFSNVSEFLKERRFVFQEIKKTSKEIKAKVKNDKELKKAFEEVNCDKKERAYEIYCKYTKKQGQEWVRSCTKRIDAFKPNINKCTLGEKEKEPEEPRFDSTAAYNEYKKAPKGEKESLIRKYRKALLKPVNSDKRSSVATQFLEETAKAIFPYKSFPDRETEEGITKIDHKRVENVINKTMKILIGFLNKDPKMRDQLLADYYIHFNITEDNTKMKAVQDELKDLAKGEKSKALSVARKAYDQPTTVARKSRKKSRKK